MSPVPDNFHDRPPTSMESPQPQVGLEKPRFRLSTLMWVVTVLAVFFAVMANVGAHATALIILFGLAVLAHVAGNAIGTKLRDNGDRAKQHRDSFPQTTSTKHPSSASAPATKLHHRTSLGWIVIVVTAFGTIASGVLGALGFWFISDNPLTPLAISLGGFAAAALGGMWTFIAASFLKVAISAAWQASSDGRPH